MLARCPGARPAVLRGRDGAGGIVDVARRFRLAIVEGVYRSVRLLISPRGADHRHERRPGRWLRRKQRRGRRRAGVHVSLCLKGIDRDDSPEMKLPSVTEDAISGRIGFKELIRTVRRRATKVPVSDWDRVVDEDR